MISDYIRLWVISHPWNMRKTKESLNPTVHQSQYTSTPRGCPNRPYDLKPRSEREPDREHRLRVIIDTLAPPRLE